MKQEHEWITAANEQRSTLSFQRWWKTLASLENSSSVSLMLHQAFFSQDHLVCHMHASDPEILDIADIADLLIDHDVIDHDDV